MLPLQPLFILAFSALALLLFGAFTGNTRATGQLTFFVLLGAVGQMLLHPYTGALFPLAEGATTGHLLTVTPFTNAAMLIMLAGALLTLPLFLHGCEGRGEKPENFILLLLALAGMFVLSAASSLLTLYVGLELMSFPLYILAASHRDDPKSAESALKYFVLGGFASGLTLFGISVFYMATGVTGFAPLAEILAPAHTTPLGGNPLILLATLLTLVGILFKLSVVPLHMWTPDVYEGSPTPVAALMSALPKVAAFALLVNMLTGPLAPVAGTWQPLLALLATFTMFIGCTLALIQSNLKRMLAFSIVTHVGFMLTAVVALAPADAPHAAQAQTSLLFYLAVYAVTSIGLFTLLMSTGAQTVAELRALARTHKAEAALFLVLLFSLAGIPPLAGFMVKFGVFSAAVSAGYTWLAFAGVLASAIAAFYSLWLIKTLYFDPLPPTPPETATNPSPSHAYSVVMGITGAVVLLLGLLPNLLTDLLP